MKVALILFNHHSLDKEILKSYYTIGVDRGALNAIKQGILLDEAIGDFDSVNAFELDLIKSNTKKIEILNPIKDDTDTYHALNVAYQMTNDVTIFGGIEGKRIEHFIANINALVHYPNLKMIDDNSYIELLSKDTIINEYIIKNYQFASFFALKEVNSFSLKGFKYELDSYNLLPFDSLCVSNEFINHPTISISNGLVLAIFSKKELN